MADEEKTEVVEGTLSLDEAAKRAGVTTHTVRRAMHAGLIKRNNSAKKPPTFSLESVQDWIAMRETQVTQADGVDSETKAQLARADAMTNMVSQAQGHTQEAFKEARLMLSEFRNGVQTLLKASLDENKRLQDRIIDLERREDEAIKLVEELQEKAYNVELAKAEGQKAIDRNRTLLDTVKLLAPAAMAVMMNNDTAREAAVESFFDTVTAEQRDVIMQSIGTVFTADQQAALMLILSKAEARRSKQDAGKANAPPKE